MAKDSKSAVPIIRTLSYEGLLIDFTRDAWFNATAAAKLRGKGVDDWLALSGTLEYIRALDETLTGRPGRILHTRDSRYVRTSKARVDRGGGTWLHPKLAVRFAQWLDAKFAVWCDMQIDEILRERILAEDLRVSEYLPTYHSLHHQVSVLAADSPNKRFIHMNINKLLNKTVGVCAGERGKLDLHGRSLMVVAQSVAISALDGAENHHDGYRAVRVRLNNFKKSLVIASFDPESP